LAHRNPHLPASALRLTDRGIARFESVTSNPAGRLAVTTGTFPSFPDLPDMGTSPANPARLVWFSNQDSVSQIKIVRINDSSQNVCAHASRNSPDTDSLYRR